MSAIAKLSAEWATSRPMQNHIFDPWKTARRLGLHIVRTKLRHARGYTDGHSTIWVDSRLPTCEERVTLAHELSHVIHGHVGEQPPEIEDMIRRVAARWLIPWPALMAQFGEQVPVEHIAENLCVTPDVIMDRLTYAAPAELDMLREATECAELPA